jgi:hypothetical protein
MDNLRGVVRVINTRTNSPQEPHGQDADGKYKGNAGCYHLDGAYGGWKLLRICDDGHGCTEALSTGYVSKRELWEAMRAFLDGLEAAELARHALTGE